jgi:hypothetical protein
MPNAEIQVVDIRKGYILTDQTALHIRALKDFTDFYGQKRLSGEEWLIDKSIKDVHIIDAQEYLVKQINIVVLQQN